MWQIFDAANKTIFWSHTILLILKTKSAYIQNKLFVVNCRAFHVASCGIFCFILIKQIRWLKRWNKKKWIRSVPKSDLVRSVKNWSHKIFSILKTQSAYGQFHGKWDKFVFSEIRNYASKVWRSYQVLSSVYKKVCYFFVSVVAKTRKPVLVELFLHYVNLPAFS